MASFSPDFSDDCLQGGIAGFLLGMTWAAGTYPWKSAPVLGSMLAGVLLLVAFVAWGKFD